MLNPDHRKLISYPNAAVQESNLLTKTGYNSTASIWKGGDAMRGVDTMDIKMTLLVVVKK